ncbi:ECF transporter S component [Paraclostridium sordellii]|uniref:ECF transporter S component n=1 Tax=Paraclostridium sordellii TaxID=1505 RepID=UPI001898B0E2|nr:ECF transporter S component [Paeniclostridium sordellii]MCR1848429.1 ECF transporter S component [Paeniclostridium sordellii]
MKKITTKELTLIALGIALNVIGAFIALNLRLPIYLDSIGTIFIACTLGAKYAVITGLCGSMVSGMTFDIYSFFFMPVQITTGLISGLMYKKGFLNGIKTPIGVLAFSIPTSILSAIIAAFVFGGVTSSGSSYIVQILGSFGIDKVTGVFLTQVVTDYIDKFIAVLIVNISVISIPNSYKLKARKN